MNIGFLTLPAISHVSQMCALASLLDNGSNGLFFFNITDTGPFIEKEGFHFHAVGKEEFPEGSYDKFWKRDLKTNSLLTAAATFMKDLRLCGIILREAPELIRKFGIELLLVDQLFVYGKAAALLSGVKYITAAVSINISPGPVSYPPGFSWWSYHPGNIFFAALNVLSGAFHELAVKLFIRRANVFLKKHNLPCYHNIIQSNSSHGIIDLMPAVLDFPGRRSGVYQIGPLARHNFNTGRYLYGKSKKPRIYVSFGTMNSKSEAFFKKLLGILSPLHDYQFIFSTGDWDRGAVSGAGLTGNITVCSFVNQLEVLKNSDLMITHGGKISVTECLYFGVPMLCIPADYDQFAISARVVYHQYGRKISKRSLSGRRLIKEINELLNNPVYKANCLKAGAAMKKIDQGKIIEKMVHKAMGGVL